MLCSKKYDFNPYAAEEGKRMVLSMSPVDWAAEWLRPVSPSYKYVGPVLAGPGKALPADLEVRPCLCMCSLRSFILARISCALKAWYYYHYYYYTVYLPKERQGASCRQVTGKGCQVPAPCWTRPIQGRPNQPWARCSVFMPPPATRGQGMV